MTEAQSYKEHTPVGNETRGLQHTGDTLLSKTDKHNYSGMESTQERTNFLNQDTSTMNLETTARFIVALNQEVLIAKGNNQKEMQEFSGKLENIKNTYLNLLSSNALSDQSKKLAETMQVALIAIQKSIESNDDTLYQGYEGVQHQVTEMAIDNAIVNLQDILSNEPSTIFVGVDKYGQNKVDSLGGCINDAVAIAQKVKMYPASQKVELHNDDATKEGILKSIWNAPIDKPMLLYMAGHGVDGHFVPFADQDTEFVDKNDKPDLKKMISPKELFDAIGDRKAVIIVDHCYSGDLVMSAPDNITIVGSTDSMSVARETDVFQKSRGFGRTETLVEESPGSGRYIKHGKATAGAIKSDHLDIRGFIKTADDQNASVNIGNLEHNVQGSIFLGR